MKTTVKNLRSDNGNRVPNQFEIIQTKKDYTKHIFQSYSTIIAEIEYKNSKRKIVFDTHALNYSRTTNRYLYKFMKSKFHFSAMNRKKIDELIEQKKIKFKNLND
jgi:hypothetical protein